MGTDYELMTVNANNLVTENICCAISDKKHRQGVQLKQEWLKAGFAEGLRYKKFNVQGGKAFIEYIPAEYAWSPIDAPGYLFIHCFWVTGRFQGHGLGKKLLEECLNDAAGANGVAVVSSDKKRPFLADKKFLLKHGFEVCDTAQPYFELLVKRVNEAPLPTFRANAKQGVCEQKQGLIFFYSDLCSYTNLWVDLMVEFAAKYKVPTQKIKLSTTEETQNAPSAFVIFSLFYNGKFVTHELLAESKFDKLMNKLLG